jgi:ABC-type bacteriocin/lantibiotic exporter with double-glycine peptidase domain
MANTGQQPATVVHHDSSVKHVHHGRTLAAWTGTTIAMVAFILGGIAVLIQNWPLFWVSVGLLVVAVIATKVLQVMGHGAH